MLFCNIDLLDENFALKRGQYVGVKDGKIAYIGDTEPQEDYGERYDGKHRLLMSGVYDLQLVIKGQTFQETALCVAKRL